MDALEILAVNGALKATIPEIVHIQHNLLGQHKAAKQMVPLDSHLIGDLSTQLIRTRRIGFHRVGQSLIKSVDQAIPVAGVGHTCIILVDRCEDKHSWFR